eukprot:7626023-Ditylum_brightwellii.AAC.1
MSLGIEWMIGTAWPQHCKQWGIFAQKVHAQLRSHSGKPMNGFNEFPNAPHTFFGRTGMWEMTLGCFVHFHCVLTFSAPQQWDFGAIWGILGPELSDDEPPKSQNHVHQA